MQQSDEYTPNAAHVSALTSVVQTLLAHVLALEPTQEAADALVARLRRASRHVPRFVADDDQHASPVSPYEEEIEACIGRIVDEAVSQDAYAHRVPPRARGTGGPETSTRTERTDGDLHDTDSRRPAFRCAQGRASGGDQGRAREDDRSTPRPRPSNRA